MNSVSPVIFALLSSQEASTQRAQKYIVTAALSIHTRELSSRTGGSRLSATYKLLHVHSVMYVEPNGGPSVAKWWRVDVDVSFTQVQSLTPVHGTMSDHNPCWRVSL